MGSPGLNAAKYRGEHSSFTYYFVPVMAILFGIFWMGHGCVGLVGAQPHPAYFATPACDDSLLLAGKLNLAPTCSVVKGSVSILSERESTYMVNTFADREGVRQMDAFDGRLTGYFNVRLPSWSSAQKDTPVFVQVFNDEGPDGKQVYLAAKIYDPVSQKIIRTSDGPLTKLGQAWADIRIALMIIAGACVWIFLGRFMVFSR